MGTLEIRDVEEGLQPYTSTLLQRAFLAPTGQQAAASPSWQKMPKRGKRQTLHTICANPAALAVFRQNLNIVSQICLAFLKIKVSFVPPPLSSLPPYTCTVPHTSQDTFSLLQDILWGAVVTASCHINFSVQLQAEKPWLISQQESRQETREQNKSTHGVQHLQANRLRYPPEAR